MTKINFKEFPLKKGLSSKDHQILDVRESLANLIYTNINGIAALTLAQKIYNSDGETEYDDNEITMLKSVAEQLCTARMIDSLNALI